MPIALWWALSGLRVVPRFYRLVRDFKAMESNLVFAAPPPLSLSFLSALSLSSLSLLPLLPPSSLPPLPSFSLSFFLRVSLKGKKSEQETGNGDVE